MKTYLFVSYTDFEHGKLTGAHKRFLELVRYLSKDNKIIMVSHAVPQLSECDNIEFYYIENPKIKKLPMHLKGMCAIVKKLKEIKNKVSYDYAISFAAVYTVCLKQTGYKNIVTLLREDTIEYLKSIGSNNLKIKYFQIYERITVKVSDKIIVQCQNDKNNLINRNSKFNKNLEKKVFVQINNINASWMKSSEENQKTEDESINIMFIGDFSNPRKGHSILLPAVKRLVDEGYKIKLFVAGDGVEKSEYEKEYANDSIIFLGRVNNINDYLLNSDINIVPSLIDSCPNTVLEGIKAGVATYGARTGGIPDLMENNEEYMFDPTIDLVYEFLVKKLKNNQFKKDALKQVVIKDHLKFDWGRKIEMIVCS